MGHNEIIHVVPIMLQFLSLPCGYVSNSFTSLVCAYTVCTRVLCTSYSQVSSRLQGKATGMGHSWTGKVQCTCTCMLVNGVGGNDVGYLPYGTWVYSMLRPNSQPPDNLEISWSASKLRPFISKLASHFIG